MIKHDFIVEIRAPIEKVFAFTTDFRNFTRWQDGVGEASQSPDGPTQPDTKFKLVRTFLGKRIEAEGAVTEFIPNHKCAFKTISGPIQLSVAQTYEVVADGTRVAIHLEAEPGGFFKLAEGAMDRQLKTAFDAQVHKLKSVLET